MRVALLCHARLGGSSQLALRLGRALRRRGHQVFLIAAAPPLGYVDGADPIWLPLRMSDRADPARLAEWEMSDEPGLRSAIAAALAPARAEVLHIHYAHPFAQCAAGLRQALASACPRMVCTLHGTDILHLPESARARLARALNALDAVTAVSLDLSTRAAAVLDIPPPRVIPNFINLDHLPERLARVGGPARFVHVSNFQPVKRVRLLVDVFARLAGEIDARLWMVGDGPDRPAMYDAIQAAGLGDRVVWWGVRKDVARILVRTDIALITSAYESFSLFALEALAAEVPVLGFDVGGLGEVVNGAGAGLLVESGDTASLAQAALALVNDPDRLARLGRRALQGANIFAEPAVAPLYERLYREPAKRFRAIG